MEGTSHIHLIGLLCLFFIIGMGSAPTEELHPPEEIFQDKIYRAYIDDHMPLWEETLEAMMQEYRQRPDPELLYDIVLAQYGLIGYYLGQNKKREAVAMLAKAEDCLGHLENSPGHEVAALLFKASFYAFHITLRPWRGISLGPASSRLIDRALELNPQCPHGHLEKGNMYFYAPSLLGGSKKQAVTYYRRSVALFEKSLPANQRWLYLGTLVSLARAYEETGDTEKAVSTLEKALEYEAGFRWVREELLPALKNQHQTANP